MATIIERVQKLLALSKSSNINEATAAAAIANRLIDEHRLSMFDLEHSAEEASEPIEEDSEYIYQSGKVTPWKRSLVMVLSNHYGCAIWNDNTFETGRQVSRYRLVGKRSDVGICRYMYSWLALECQRLADLEVKGCGRVFIASYCMGFVNGVSEQLRASRMEVQKTATSTAIVKLDARLEASKSVMYSLHNNLVKKSSYSHSRVDNTAYRIGESKGKAVHLGASLGGSKLLGSGK
jgi:Protein of unknown function (DUF2786)